MIGVILYGVQNPKTVNLIGATITVKKSGRTLIAGDILRSFTRYVTNGQSQKNYLRFWSALAHKNAPRIY